MLHHLPTWQESTPAQQSPNISLLNANKHESIIPKPQTSSCHCGRVLISGLLRLLLLLLLLVVVVMIIAAHLVQSLR
jgi:hypothetical protein